MANVLTCQRGEKLDFRFDKWCSSLVRKTMSLRLLFNHQGYPSRRSILPGSRKAGYKRAGIGLNVERSYGRLTGHGALTRAGVSCNFLPFQSSPRVRRPRVPVLRFAYSQPHLNRNMGRRRRSFLRMLSTLSDPRSSNRHVDVTQAARRASARRVRRRVPPTTEFRRIFASQPPVRPVPKSHRTSNANVARKPTGSCDDTLEGLDDLLHAPYPNLPIGLGAFRVSVVAVDATGIQRTAVV